VHTVDPNPDKSELHQQLSKLIENTAVGEVLKQVDESLCVYFYELYLHDFVRLVHICNHKDRKDDNREYEVIGIQYI